MSLLNSAGHRYILNAYGSDFGWNTDAITAQGKDDSPPTFEFSGNQASVTIPWDDLGGPGPFKWIATASWTGNPDRGASYAFDSIPNRGFASFPKGS